MLFPAIRGDDLRRDQQVPEVWPSVAEAALAFARTAATSVRQTPHKSAHSPGILEFLRNYLGEPLPDPQYSSSHGPEADEGESLATLFEEFVADYLETEKGELHLASYARVRSDGRAHFDRIKELKKKGADITDDVLLHLLPHTNSKGNRERGAWVHVAPAVTKDLKTWFEGAGWAQREDWPRIASAIWEFVERCEADPARLAEECSKFAQLDFIKGFQAGLLTPILNALHPNRFHVINSKSRQALNHFADTDYSSKLVDYPSANAALTKLLEQNSDVLTLEEHPDVPAADLFDVFSHWLVAVRKSFNVEEIDFHEDESADNLDDDIEPPIEEASLEAEAGDDDSPTLQPTYTRERFLSETGFADGQLDEWLRILRRKRQIVLQGPPGTGKTFVAQRLARLLVSGTDGLWNTVQFHPAYAYEDFMRGIRPRVVRGSLSYEWEDGRFVRFCLDAELRQNPCVLVIDEINRANLARVFGELMYLLEYRGDHIPLAGGDGRFTIPPNVFLVGTMNTADRSIARLDHALRRRFSFVRLRPDYQVLKGHLEGHGLPAASLVEALQSVNRLIGDPNYEIGISYFMRDEPDLPDHLPDIWKYEVETYLEEYFYDQPAKVEDYRWESLKNDRLAEWAQIDR